MPEMKQVAVSIVPPLPEAARGGHAFKALEHSDFQGKNSQYIVSFVFGDRSVNYGSCSLFEYYADICQEIFALESGQSHDIEMSGYPVASLVMSDHDCAQVTIYAADEHGTPAEFTEEFSLTGFLEQLKSAKAEIEAFVLI
jgi:hypothetical protein